MIDEIIAWLNESLGWVLIVTLLTAGVLFTVLTRGVQFRHFGTMWRTIFSSRGNAGQGVSSFQAFAISLASRVGTGNIVGVAVALTLGGPGAIFWMWVMALFGMATAFIEATLAQLYKIRHGEDHTFRGGPAYYIQAGMGVRWLGIVFAVALIFTFGFAFNMVQANTIAGVVQGTWGIEPLWTAIVLTLLAGVIIFGGIKSVARVAEFLAPGMALVYVLLAVAVLVVRAGDIPEAVGQIFAGAFGLDQALAGTAGGILAALLNGVRRGMFSNEAGMGSAPNAAATANASHPVQQGLIQSAGVFVDTIIICTATALMILLSAPDVYTPGVTQRDVSATLTQTALASELGTWVAPVMAVLIFVFAFSSVLGNYTYAEVNQDFIGGGRVANYATRALAVGAVFWGALQELGTVWSLADVAMSVMAVINLTALAFLGVRAVEALKDFDAQKGLPPMERTLVIEPGSKLDKAVPGDMWREASPTRVTS
ncbi:alanine/glycine:cation symporter family protein [Propioniciclava soli]|uniref:Alanine/glycine:cation symporter family protein n=1 Tax=Propioniciclava soli TaxID=2775081 RepID=A0ABZ3C280_9ACTN|nr:alanine/glycine:cation symporter family protein [Propioniciclava soli]